MNNILFLINKKQLINNFNSYNDFNKIYYTLKTNSNNNIIKLLNDISNDKIYFSISNLKHFKILKNNNVTAERINVINPFLPIKDINNLYNNGVRSFTFTSINDILIFEKFANTFDVSINIRLNINNFIIDKSYIGVSLKEYEQIFNHIKGKYKSIGISVYLPQTIKCHNIKLKYILNKILKLPKDYIIFGGIPNANELKWITDYKNINLEIGQNLLKNVIDLKTNIIKHYKNKIILSNGIYGGLLDVILYNKKFKIYLLYNSKKIYLKNKIKSKSNKINIYGPTADSLDIIGEYYLEKKYINILNNSKYLYIKDVGPYFEEFFMKYNNSFNTKYKILGG